MIDPLLVNALVILGVMLTTWAMSVSLRDASIVDPVWGLGFVIVAVAAAAQRGFALAPLEWALVGMTGVWGLRLFLYLLWRKRREPEEDRRYGAMREHWGDRFWWVSLFTVFLLQGVIMWVIALPLQLALRSGAEGPGPSAMLFLVAVCLWAVGVFFESVGDWQLAAFKAAPENRGRVLDTGLWRYTRHPNYFGDFCVWWGLWGASVLLGAPLWTLVCPAAMSVLLMRVSGVTLTESTITARRPEYADYQRRTSPFFPRPPRGDR